MIDMDECTCLIEEKGSEGDTELGRHNRKATFLPLMRCIEFCDCLSSFSVGCLLLDLLVHDGNVPVFQALVEMRLLIGFVEVDLS